MLLKEIDPARSASEHRKQLRGGLLRELRDQSEWTLNRWGYADRRSPPADLSLIAPGDTLNPLVSVLKCSQPQCRARATVGFGRYVALYTDGAILPDYMTSALARGDERSTFEVIDSGLPYLRALLPLVKAGLLRFARPYLESEGPDGEAHRFLDTTVDALIETHRDAFVFEYFPYGRWPRVFVSNPHVIAGAEPIIHFLSLSKNQYAELAKVARLGNDIALLPPKSLDLVRPSIAEFLSRALHGLLIQMHTASAAKATLVLGGPAEIFVLRQQGSASESRLPRRLERQRTVRLPWLEDLSIGESVRLRESAGLALERLRARVRTASESNDDQRLSDLIAELNEEAAEVEAELRSLRTSLPRLMDSGFAVIGIGLVVYGLTDSSLVAAAAGFSSVLAKLRDEVRTRREGILRQMARPGYALLKARQLLGSRPRSHAAAVECCGQ
jgi:hypothetical protein